MRGPLPARWWRSNAQVTPALSGEQRGAGRRSTQLPCARRLRWPSTKLTHPPHHPPYPPTPPPNNGRTRPPRRRCSTGHSHRPPAATMQATHHVACRAMPTAALVPSMAGGRSGKRAGRVLCATHQRASRVAEGEGRTTAGGRDRRGGRARAAAASAHPPPGATSTACGRLDRDGPTRPTAWTATPARCGGGSRSASSRGRPACNRGNARGGGLPLRGRQRPLHGWGLGGGGRHRRCRGGPSLPPAPWSGWVGRP